MKLGRFIFLSAFITAFSYASYAHAQLELTAGNSATTTPNVATSITGFQIVGPAASTTPVKLRATSGTLNLSVVSGVTMSGNGSGTVNLSGTVANLNTALATLTYRRNSTGTDTLEVSLVQPTEVFFEDNGHLYQYISGSFTWSAAKTAAEGRTAYGSTGYLATITSSAENNFVYQRISGDGWLGTNDIETEKTWKWVTGPEAGTSYFQENPSDGGGSAISGRYHSWASDEPNDYGSGEDCGYMYASQGGNWNDFPCSALQGYVVEFGADGDLPTVVAQNISIVTADVPAITSLSPANGATSVSPSANLVIGLSKSVTKQTGNILIKKYADDSTAVTIDASSDAVSGSGTNSITINPPSDLEEGTQYYVIIPNTALEDGSGNSFEGISSKTTWSFTTADVTPPAISTFATSTATTTATLTWTTNEAASSRIIYGLTNSYGSVTSETNTSPRVTSHSVALTNLLACTTYHVAAVSRDATGNSATSTDATFTTKGCASSAEPTVATSTNITASTGGVTEIEENGKTFSVEAPANATATSSSFVIQVKAIPSSSVLSSIGRPSAALSEVGVTVFDVKAIIDGDTILDSFDAEVTIEYEYADDEIAGLDESSLWLYHYSDGEWAALNACTVDVGTNTISCTTPSFSIFGLFGSGASGDTGVRSRSGSGTKFGCKDTSALNYDYFSRHTQELCEYAEDVSDDVIAIIRSYKNLFLEAMRMGISLPVNILRILDIATADAQSFGVRDLEYGMEGEDVRMLQELLMREGYEIPAGATGYFGFQTEYALDAYQVANNIAPRGGYFGEITRAQMSAVGMSGLWW